MVPPRVLLGLLPTGIAVEVTAPEIVAGVAGDVPDGVVAGPLMAAAGQDLQGGEASLKGLRRPDAQGAEAVAGPVPIGPGARVAGLEEGRQGPPMPMAPLIEEGGLAEA